MKRGEALKLAQPDPLGQRWIHATYGEGMQRRQYVCVRDELGNERVEVRTWEYGVSRVNVLTHAPWWVEWEPV